MMSEAEVDATVAKLSSAGAVVSLSDFVPYMVERLTEPGHSQADVTTAFRELSVDVTREVMPYILRSRIVHVFHDAADVQYLFETMPAGAGGSAGDAADCDYNGYVPWLFSR